MTTLSRHFALSASPALPHAGRIGLRAFMAVVTVLFLLPILAYAMRMYEPNQMPILHPVLLWWNTGVLALASAAMELVRRAHAYLTIWLLAGGAFIALFAFDQWVAWQRLSVIEQGVTVNSPNSFLYVFTGLHAAYVIGGLVVWAAMVARVHRYADRTRRVIDPYAAYWHFLLAVRLVLLAAMWWITPTFVSAICEPLYGVTS